MTKELELVLDELVAGAPVENADWDDVRERAGRRSQGRQRRNPRKRLLVALAATALLGLAGAAVAVVGVDRIAQQEAFHAARPNQPKRIGPFVEVTSESDWSLIAWRSRVGICLDFVITNNSSFSCGFPVRGAKSATDASGAGLPTHAVAGFRTGALVGGDGKSTIHGVSAREVEAVTVELADGRTLETELYEAPPELNAEIGIFIVRLRLPSGRENPIRAYNAYGPDGTLIERVVD
jgi:hypothetical protein